MLHLAATTSPLAATGSSHHPGLGVLVLLGLVWAVGYLLWCWISPFATCRHCSGSGNRRTRFGRGFRDCRHCDGSGHQLRPGRRILNELRSIHRASK
ncbi:MAG: hypothetical protein ACRDPK_05220 [Carbonactinosporaceae bacterium]